MAELRGQMQSSLQCASSNFITPVPTSIPKRSHGDFRRVQRIEDSIPLPIPGLAADVLHMRVKEGSKIRNLLRFATARMQGEGKDSNGTPLRQVVFTGSGRGVTKTITCVEILKRKVGGLHQVSKLYYKTVKEVWGSPQQGAADVTMQRTLPAICILLSKDSLDPQELGYQPPETPSATSEEHRRQGELLRLAHSSCTQHTAKRFCLHDLRVCPAQMSTELTTACERSDDKHANMLY